MSGLQRIVLIDTHLPGVVELKLDGHTNICGTNASGKTTLQRLLPVFYGEYPSKVVPSTRDSFERWYLRHESSYIIYEYQRFDGVLCQAILTSTGKGVDYRLINREFDLQDYAVELRSGEHKIITSVELSRKLKREGINCTRQLNTREYRAIIQNDRSILNSSRELPNMAATYSMTDQGNNLRHIEKLAKAVHSKEGKMDTVRSMIAAILEEDGITPPVNTIKLKEVENWIKERKLIKSFEQIRPEFVKLQQCYQTYQQNDRRLADLQHSFDLDNSKLAKQIIEQEAALEEVQLLLKQLAREWQQQSDELNKQWSAAKSDVTTHSGNLEKLELTYDDWQQQDIESLIEKVQLLEGWKSELESAQQQLDLLTQEHQDVESAYNKRLKDIEQRHSRELEGFIQQNQTLSSELNDKKLQQQGAEAEINAQFVERKAELRQSYQQQLETLKLQLTELNTLQNNVSFTEQEQQQIELLEANIAEANEREDISRDRLREMQADVDQLLKQREDKLGQLTLAEKAKLQAVEAKEAVEAMLYPGHNTLLEHLRRQHPAWSQTIGKVINPDLLQRTDLKPEAADGESFYGVVLDLIGVEQPQYANDEIQLQQALEQAQLGMEQAIEAVDELNEGLSQLNQQVRDKELNLTQAKTELSNKEQTRRRLQSDKDALQREFQQARSERKQSYKKRIQDNQQQQQKLNAQREQALEQLDEDKHEALMDCRSHWQLLVGDIEQQIDALEQQQVKAKQTVKLQKKQCDTWFKDELAKRDVDVEQIGKLKSQTEQLNHNILDTEKNRHKVGEYQHWYRVYYTQQKLDWQQQLTAAKKLEAESAATLNQLQSEFQQNKQLNDEKQLRVERQLKATREQLEALRTLAKALSKLNLPNTEYNPIDEALAQRLGEGNELLNKRISLLEDIRVYVDHFDSQIASQSGSGLADIWDKSREECSKLNEQGIRAIDHIGLVSHLDQLLNVHVPQHLTGLKEEGRILGKNLAEYYNVLKEIEAHIGNQSKRISREVDEELFLDGVSDSAVKIRSRIAELDFWQELQAFNRYYLAWMEQGASQLPDEDFVQSMRCVLDILGRSALEGGIAKLLDIELHIHEGDSDLVIRTDRQLNESSSHGMAYLILCKFLLAFTRLLRGKAQTAIHWPIDELGTLHQSNIKKIFDACQNNNIRVLGAFPNPESEVLTLFQHRYLIAKKDGQRRLQVVQPKLSPIAQRIQQQRETQETGQ